MKTTKVKFSEVNMTRVEALDIARDLLDDYMSGSPDVDENFKEAEEILTRIRNSIQKQNFKRKFKQQN